jgi:uncharacterized membrane protein
MRVMTVPRGAAARRPKRGVELMNFVKTTLLAGLFVLLPLMLLWIGIKEIGGLLTEMATPIADLFVVDLFPAGTFDHLSAPGLVALVVIVGASFVVGLAARSSMLSALGRRIETSVLERVPMYRMLKLISHSLIDSETGNVKPALLLSGTGSADPCYVIEVLKDGRAAVLLPWSPASFAGTIKVVGQENLEYLSCSLDEFSRAISQVGVGLRECIGGEHRSGD